MKKKFIIIILVLLGLGLLLAHNIGRIQDVLFKRKPAEKVIETEVLAGAIPVKVYKVKRMAFKDTLPAMGTIKGFKEVSLKFETSGVLESLNFEEGEKIQEGDIIANINQKDALLKLKYAELELEKAKTLFDIGGVAKIKFDQAKLEYESAKSDFEKTNIYAISDGMLGDKKVDVGAYVTPNDEIGTFVDISYVYAEFNIIERDSPKLKLGQKVEIFVDAYPNKSFKGTVDSISPIIEGRTRTQRTRIELKNADFGLKPGMFTRALIATYENEDALIIPSSAFKKKEADYFVYVVHKEAKPESEEEEEEGEEEIEETEPIFETGTVEVRKIGISYLTQDMAEIGEGLEEGELIIIEVFQEFNDEDKVEITEIQETLF